MNLPNVIKKLDDAVINRIAAGEIIQRPANALKELIENSLDACSTNIQISVKNGGLKLLQIQDNGTGIRKESFDIVCERFTTSKLTKYEDLQSIATYGFRGEALASISHVAHLSITSKTATELCAYLATYIDGKLQGNLKPIAGVQGTIISVEDLFYNMDVRRNALREVTVEYQKILDVVSKYAVHNSKVGFSLKKAADKNDIRTPPNSTCVENIGILYGNTISRELIEFFVENEGLSFKANGYMTNVNYSTKKFSFLLFINHRLVECKSLKKCIDQVYCTYLPKNSHPFVYLNLEINPRHVDVNVHPTKHEVNFLNEDQIVEIITTALENKLLGSNNSRYFYTQAKLPALGIQTSSEPKEDENNKDPQNYPKYKVRTDSKMQKLEKFFGPSITLKSNGDKKADNKTGNNIGDVSITDEVFDEKHKEFINHVDNFEDKIMNKTDIEDMDVSVAVSNNDALEINMNITVTKEEFNTDGEENNESKVVRKEDESKRNELGAGLVNDVESKSPKNKIIANGLTQIAFLSKLNRVDTDLWSILTMRKKIENECNFSMREVFAQHVFVGAVDESRALIQHSTKLYLCDTRKLMHELFHQYAIYNFQNLGRIELSERASIFELATLGLDCRSVGWRPEDGPKEELASAVVRNLREQAKMLNEYFSLDIDDDGNLIALPLLIDSYVPDMSGLPEYIVRLATEVDYTDEYECFRTFAIETARYYSQISKNYRHENNDWKWTIEHCFYPALKNYFIPSGEFLKNGAVYEIANLPNLYKVFERC